MSVGEPFNIYREQLSSLYHGLALWDPKPVENLHKQPGHVSIGDVGYLDNGVFMRMFNVTLPWNDPSNELLGKPEKYERIKPGKVRENKIREGVYRAHVSEVDNDIGANRHEDSLGQIYRCRAQHYGALLSLPYNGHSKDVIHRKEFEIYVRDNVDNWFRWSKKMKLPVDHMEDLILVTGCTLVTSWAAVAFNGYMPVDSDSDATRISLEAIKVRGGKAQFFWRNIRGNVEYHNSHFDPNIQEPLPQNQCVFIRGFRAKRTFFRIIPMRAAAEPRPDDPDDRREDEMQVTQIPDSSKYRDPLVGILDYIMQKCNEDTSTGEDIIAIAHDDDLRLIEGVENLTADAIENFLREKQMPLIVNNGSAILCDPADNEPPVSHERKKERSAQTDPDQPFNIYREQISSQYPAYGLPLWDPNPVDNIFKDPGHVSIGDVGYLENGTFVRIFNVKLPRDHLSNKFIEIPEGYKPLEQEYFDNVFRSEVYRKEYHPHVTVSKVDNIRVTLSKVDTCKPDEDMGQTYECLAQSHGALLFLPHGAHSEDVIRIRSFKEYIKDNVDSWLRWSKKAGLPIKNIEDLILVTGCTLAKSWAVVAFDSTTSRDEDTSAISLDARKSDGGGTQFIWSNIRGNVKYHNSHFDPIVQGPLPQNQCVFIRGLRAKRTFFRTLRLMEA